MKQQTFDSQYQKVIWHANNAASLQKHIKKCQTKINKHKAAYLKILSKLLPKDL